MSEIELTVNGKFHRIDVQPWETLLDILRERLQLTGTKEGCGLGECGACTVIVEGLPVNSCLIPAIEAEGKEIQTIEGSSINGKLHPLQQSFISHGGVQCGFCTPGMILSSKSLLKRNPNPTEEEIREGIAGNFCRCTGYTKIIESIMAAAEEMKGKE